MTLTEEHLDDLGDDDLRTIALCVLNDAVSAVNKGIEEYGLGDLPDLDPAQFHHAADWLREVLSDPTDYDLGILHNHTLAVAACGRAARSIGESQVGDGYGFPLFAAFDTVDWLLHSVYDDDGSYRLDPRNLRFALESAGGFLPRWDSEATYVIRTFHPSDDPRHAALAESYLQSGLHTNIWDAIAEATEQLGLLDGLTDLNL